MILNNLYNNLNIGKSDTVENKGKFGLKQTKDGLRLTLDEYEISGCNMKDIIKNVKAECP